MQTYRARPLDATKILTRRELAAVLNDLKRKAPRSKNTRLNLALFRLACCCGLRASEIANLQVGDVRTELARPHIRIRNGAAKGGRSRMVPLWWDTGTLEDIRQWKADRLALGADYDEPFLASLIPGRAVKPFSRHTLRKRFRTACRVLGASRLDQIRVLDLLPQRQEQPARMRLPRRRPGPVGGRVGPEAPGDRADLGQPRSTATGVKAAT
jgi:integrase